MAVTLTNDERRALADTLVDTLAERGLTLGDVERLAPVLVDRFRLASSSREGGAAVDSGGGSNDG